MSCLVAQDTAHRYVAGALAPPDDEQFETHLLECEECRDVVRVGVAIRPALAGEQASRAISPPRAARRVARGTFAVAAALAAAAVAVFVVADRGRGEFGALAAVTAPGFTGSAVRGERDSAATAVETGMTAYAAGDYRAAVRALGVAVRRDSSAGLSFYYGASLLLTRDAAGALIALRRAHQPPGNPFSSEARVLAAKAWLRLREPDSALAELRAASAGERASAHARALADSIVRAVR